MSDTPRTEKAWDDPNPVAIYYLSAELERENAALRAELAPLRETVGVAATASTCADDLSNWSKLVERADNSTRLERENAALHDAATIIRNALEQYDSSRVNGNQYRLINTVRRAISNAARKEAQP